MKTQITIFKSALSLLLISLALLIAGCEMEEGSGGKLIIDSAPSGTDLMLNGKSVGKTPQTISGLVPGEYTVELRREGYSRTYKKVALLDGQEVEMQLPLMQTAGLLLVTSEPSGSEVVINNEVKGTTPALVTDLPLGTYDVTVRSAGLPPSTFPVELLDRKPVKKEVRHAPRVAVNSYPPGAEILVNGELKGIAPLVLQDIPMGEHILLAQLDQHDSQEKKIILMAGLNDAVEFNLEKNSGTLVMDTEPAQVEVYVDGTLFATTQPKEGADSMSQPLRIALKAGVDHNIQLVREGHTSASLKVRTDIDQVVTKHIVLKRIFVYDTRITTKTEVIPCRLEYKLPNGNLYYERFPGVYNTAKAADILDVQPISLDDASNREARQLLEQSRKDVLPSE